MSDDEFKLAPREVADEHPASELLREARRQARRRLVDRGKLGGNPWEDEEEEAEGGAGGVLLPEDLTPVPETSTFQFSIGTMLIATAAVGAGLSIGLWLPAGIAAGVIGFAAIAVLAGVTFLKLDHPRLYLLLLVLVAAYLAAALAAVARPPAGPAPRINPHGILDESVDGAELG